MVTSDDPSSREVIRTFKGDTVPVIVSVQMFSEGVDAPRIRVISYLSRKTAPLFFLQVIGRAVRMQTGDQYPDPFRQWAHMIMPADPELDLMACQVEEQIGHIVGPTVDVPPRIPTCPECGLEHCKPRVGSPCPACGYEPEPIETGGSLRTCISGFGEREGLISMGAMADELTLSTVEDKLRNDINLRMRFTAEQLTFAAMFLARNPDIVV
jgi:hypothetical protein